MSHVGSTTFINTNLFGSTTPVNQTRTGTGTGLLFGSTPTSTQSNSLLSTPFGSTSPFGRKIKIISDKVIYYNYLIVRKKILYRQQRIQVYCRKGF